MPEGRHITLTKQKKMKTYILTTVIFLTLFNSSLFSQTDDDNTNKEKIVYKFSVGAGVGYTTGYGASFRYTPNKFGVQANFTPMYNESITQISAGITFIYNIIETEKTCFYLYQGNHLYYYNWRTANYYQQLWNDTEYTRFNNGVGVGIQFIILKRVGLDIMGGYAFYENFKRLGLTGEAGLYYKF
jgi:hypothetical protein